MAPAGMVTLKSGAPFSSSASEVTVCRVVCSLVIVTTPSWDTVVLRGV